MKEVITLNPPKEIPNLLLIYEQKQQRCRYALTCQINSLLTKQLLSKF